MRCWWWSTPFPAMRNKQMLQENNKKKRQNFFTFPHTTSHTTDISSSQHSPFISPLITSPNKSPWYEEKRTQGSHTCHTSFSLQDHHKTSSSMRHIVIIISSNDHQKEKRKKRLVVCSFCWVVFWLLFCEKIERERERENKWMIRVLHDGNQKE